MNKGILQKIVFIAGILLAIGLTALGLYFGASALFKKAPDQDSQVLSVQDPTVTCNPEIIQAESPQITLTPIRQWYLKDVSEYNKINLEIHVEGEPEVCLTQYHQIDYQIENKAGKIVKRDVIAQNTNDRYSASINLDKLAAGEYQFKTWLMVATESEEQLTDLAYFDKEIKVSYPVYIAWTIDWEGFPIQDQYLSDLNKIAKRNHKMPLTHYFMPRYFVGGVSKSQANQYKNWVLNRQKKYDDQIGLHIHPFYDLVRAAGVTPRKANAWNKRGDGYDVPLSSYTYQEQLKIISWGKKELEKKGLGKPTTFRAGGWFANEDTLKALSNLGFKSDSSARTSYSIGTNPQKGNWNIKATQQPYYACLNNQNLTCSKNNSYNVLEVPNNGADSYAFSAQDMKNRFKANYNGKVQKSAKSVVYLSHPEWFYKDKPKLNQLFKYLDKHVIYSDDGPALYVTIETIRKAFK